MSVASTERRAWFALAAMIPTVLIVGLDVTILSVALPTLARDLNASTSQLQWFVMAYALTYAAAIIPSGLLGDRIGRRSVLVGSVCLFAVGSLACAISSTAAELLAARAFLGLGAAGIATLSLAVINVLFDDVKRPKAMRLLMMVNMLGFPLGPILGGWMLGHFAWGWIFAINIPIAAIAIPVLLKAMPESRSSQRPSWDLWGLVSVTGGVVALCYGVTEAGSKSWSSVPVWLPALVGVVLIALFIRIESRASKPMVPLSIFRHPNFALGAAAACAFSFVVAGTLFIVPQYTQTVLGVDTETSGFYLIAFAVGMGGAMPLTGKLAKKFGREMTVVIGMTMLIVALALAAMTTISSTGLWLVIWSALAGGAMGVGLPTSVELAISSLDVDMSGIGSAALQSTRQVATTLGAALLGSILSAKYRSALPNTIPAELKHVARDGVVQGLAVAHKLASPELVHAVRSGFVLGMRWANGASAGVAILVVLALGLVLVQRHRHQVRESGMAAGA